MYKIIFYFACVALIISFAVHFASILHHDVQEYFPYIWILHIGIFVVWIPVILFLRPKLALVRNEATRIIKPSIFLKTISENAPKWLIIIAICCFIYVPINFALFLVSSNGNSVVSVGEVHILQNHGEFIDVLTEEKFHSYQANELRGFSGHWLMFYAVGMMVLYPSKKPDQNIVG